MNNEKRGKHKLMKKGLFNRLTQNVICIMLCCGMLGILLPATANAQQKEGVYGDFYVIDNNTGLPKTSGVSFAAGILTITDNNCRVKMKDGVSQTSNRIVYECLGFGGNHAALYLDNIKINTSDGIAVENLCDYANEYVYGNCSLIGKTGLVHRSQGGDLLVGSNNETASLFVQGTSDYGFRCDSSVGFVCYENDVTFVGAKSALNISIAAYLNGTYGNMKGGLDKEHLQGVDGFNSVNNIQQYKYVTIQAGTNKDKGNANATEKKQQEISDKLGVSAETAKKVQQVAATYNVSDDTLYITDKTVLAQKNDNDIKGSSFARLRTVIRKARKKSQMVKWNKVNGADGYIVYGNQCGENYKVIATIKNGASTSFTNKKLKSNCCYKYMVRAYKLVDGNQITLVASKTIHGATLGKYSTVKSVKVNKKKVTVKRGKKFVIKASEVKKNKKKKAVKHVPIRYESTKTNIASVSKKGKIKAVKKGTCYIYVYANSGIFQKVTVKVK